MTETSTDKIRFLTLYDYETGGIWAFVVARTPDEITEMFRDLEVMDSIPEWMTGEQLTDIEEKMTFDIDDIKPGDWIARLLKS